MGTGGGLRFVNAAGETILYIELSGDAYLSGWGATIASVTQSLWAQVVAYELAPLQAKANFLQLLQRMAAGALAGQPADLSGLLTGPVAPAGEEAVPRMSFGAFAAAMLATIKSEKYEVYTRVYVGSDGSAAGVPDDIHTEYLYVIREQHDGSLKLACQQLECIGERSVRGTYNATRKSTAFMSPADFSAFVHREESNVNSTPNMVNATFFRTAQMLQPVATGGKSFGLKFPIASTKNAPGQHQQKLCFLLRNVLSDDPELCWPDTILQDLANPRSILSHYLQEEEYDSFLAMVAGCLFQRQRTCALLHIVTETELVNDPALDSVLECLIGNNDDEEEEKLRLEVTWQRPDRAPAVD